MSIGTSINGIGASAATSIRRMNSTEAKIAFARVDEILTKRVRFIDDELINVQWIDFD
ncbi:MAG TPA: hypothetical protein VGO35_01440 [Gammaproteobacteria bacterium]|nr:hypothetical protein [Gammaproteobacteria bacterium]